MPNDIEHLYYLGDDYLASSHGTVVAYSAHRQHAYVCPFCGLLWARVATKPYTPWVAETRPCFTSLLPPDRPNLWQEPPDGLIAYELLIFLEGNNDAIERNEYTACRPSWLREDDLLGDSDPGRA